MKKVWFMGGALLLLAVVAGGCRKSRGETASAPLPAPAGGALDLKLATFNIRNEENRDPGERSWDRRTLQAVRLIRRLEPDVLGMQELTHGQAADLRASLPDYGFYGQAREDGDRKGEYAGIFYRRDRFGAPAEGGTFWLSATPDKAGSSTWGNTFPRIATWVRLVDRTSGRGFYVYNTHFDHRHQGSRERAARLIAGRIDGRSHPEEPVVLLGDFNAQVSNPALAYLHGSPGMVAGEMRRWETPLLETFQSLHPAGTAPQTLHFWGTRQGWKIDHIFVSQGAQVFAAEVAADKMPFSSDHFPVTARVIFP